MRLTLVVCSGLALACSCKQGHDKPASNAPQPVENTPAPAIKHEVSKAPLPALATDTGGATGKPIWQAGFGGYGIDVPRGVAVGAGNEVYVAGYFDSECDFGGAVGKKASAGGSDGFLAKLTTDGKMAWMQQFGAKRDDDAKAVAAHGDRVVVVGNFLDEIKAGEYSHKAVGSDDLFAAAYDKDGTVQWLWTLGGIDSDGANTIASAPDGGWVIGGSYSDSITIGSTTLKSKGKTDALLIKLAPGGDLQWIKSFGGRYDDTIMRVAVDGNNNIYVAGHFADTSDWGGKPLKAHGGSDNDIVLAKYDVNGDHVWSQNFGNMFNDVAGGLSVDPAGHITLVGSFENKGPISFGDGDEHNSLGEADAYVARFTTDGKLEWAHTFGAERVDVAWGVASDAAGNTVTTGWFENTVDFGKGAVASKGNKDMFALKLDAKGNVVWVNTWGDHDHDQARGVALDDKGNAIVVGAFRFKLDLVGPVIEGKRPENDPVLSKAPKPDVAVVKFAR
ncbi:MAG TPA: SBBP repeat-containing protein [Kofleriaceae bacterium]|nr:SBBP repeat-containing protein [Kofleriaceae bacterium]